MMKKIFENWNRFLQEEENEDDWSEYMEPTHDVFKFPSEHEKFARGEADVKPSPSVQSFDMPDVDFSYLGGMSPSQALTDLATNYLFSIKTGGELPVATILKRLLKAKKAIVAGPEWDEEWFAWVYKRVPKTLAKIRRHVEGDDEDELQEAVPNDDGVVRWGNKKRVEWAINPFADRGAYGELEEDKWEDKIPGGLADKKSPFDFDQEQLRKGVAVEMEHTDDPKKALEIAMDHLTEFPNYYSALDKMEKGLDKDLQEENEKPLNKPIRTPGENKKFKVYVRDPGTGKIKTVRFGDSDMEIKRDNPERRKSFRARHNCDNPGPKTKARYWSCKQWRAGSKVISEDEYDYLEEAPEDEERWKKLADMGDRDAQDRLDRLNWRREPDAYLSYQHDTQKMYALKNSRSNQERMYWKEMYNENLEAGKRKLTTLLDQWLDTSSEETIQTMAHDYEFSLQDVEEELRRYSSAPLSEIQDFLVDLENHHGNPNEMLKRYASLVGAYGVDYFGPEDGLNGIYYVNVGHMDAPTLMWDNDDYEYSFEAYSDMAERNQNRWRTMEDRDLVIAVDHSGFNFYIFEDEIPWQQKDMVHDSVDVNLGEFLMRYDTTEELVDEIIDELREE